MDLMVRMGFLHRMVFGGRRSRRSHTPPACGCFFYLPLPRRRLGATGPTNHTGDRMARRFRMDCTGRMVRMGCMDRSGSSDRRDRLAPYGSQES